MARLLVFVIVSYGAPAAAADCSSTKLPSDVQALIKPLLQVRNQEAAENFTDDGRWKGESSVAPEAQRRFEDVLRNRTSAGDRALAYLLFVYVGEHPGEELVCEVQYRGNKMLSLIDEYERCLPQSGAEPLHKYVVGSGVLPGMAIEAVRSGEKCGND